MQLHNEGAVKDIPKIILKISMLHIASSKYFEMYESMKSIVKNELPNQKATCKWNWNIEKIMTNY